MVSIQVRPYHDCDAEAYEGYVLPEEQAIYTSMPARVLEAFGADRRKQPYTILADGEVAGCFVLTDHEELRHYTDDPDAILFKSFSVDARYQRSGYALQALLQLPELVRREAPGKREVVLTVHHTNEPAIRLYRKAGFQDRGLRYDGECGEEWILHLVLNPEGPAVLHSGFVGSDRKE